MLISVDNTGQQYRYERQWVVANARNLGCLLNQIAGVIDDVHIVAGSATQRVRARAPVQKVVARTANQDIGTTAAAQHVIARATIEEVVAGISMQCAPAAVARINRVVSKAAVERVKSGPP